MDAGASARIGALVARASAGQGLIETLASHVLLHGNGAFRIGIVTFESFPDPLTSFDVVVGPVKATGEPVTVTVQSPKLLDAISSELAAPSVSENFTQGLRQRQDEARAAAESALAGAKKSGCMVLVAVLSLSLGLAACAIAVP